jgi:hypothetical protein
MRPATEAEIARIREQDRALAEASGVTWPSYRHGRLIRIADGTVIAVPPEKTRKEILT